MDAGVFTRHEHFIHQETGWGIRDWGGHDDEHLVDIGHRRAPEHAFVPWQDGLDNATWLSTIVGITDFSTRESFNLPLRRHSHRSCFPVSTCLKTIVILDDPACCHNPPLPWGILNVLVLNQ